MTLHPKSIDLTLDRVQRLLPALKNPQVRLPPVIHIAGTNGKGSTLAMVRAGLEGCGKRVHAYTSPHLVRFHERIRLAGTLISEPQLAAVLAECEAHNGDAPITHFEITTCAAFLAFARAAADFTLLEVGLGGRLDATNVVPAPRLTVITPIALDHQSFLGESLAQIAAEKAGILKRGVPCVVAPQPQEAEAVIQARARALGVPLFTYGQHWQVHRRQNRLLFKDDRGALDLPLPALVGPHQVGNAGTAIAVLRQLGLPDRAYGQAMTDVRWPARLQRLTQGPLSAAAPQAELWLDGGHNPAAGAALAQAVAQLPKRPLHLICGMLNTKSLTDYLRPLARQAASVMGVAIPGERNTLPADRVAQGASTLGVPARAAQDVAAAIKAIAAQTPTARVLICGSLYLAGQVLRENG